MNRHVSPRRRGFTLIELLVVVAVGTIVISGVYTIYQSSVRGYRVQTQADTALAQLRMAVSQLRAQLRSAAFNAPAQSNVEPWVTVPSGDLLSAVAVDVDANAPVVLPSANENLAPQRIRLLGDFVAHKQWRTASMNGTTISIDWDVVSDGDQADFDRIFNQDHLLRVETYGTARDEWFVPILSTNYKAGLFPEIVVSEPITGILGLGEGNEVSVSHYLRYELRYDDRDDTQRKIDLVRVKLQADGATEVADSALAVAENIVDLQIYDLCMNITAPDLGDMSQEPVEIQCFPTLADLGAAGFSIGPGIANQSHLLRAMTVKVSARSAFEDEDVPFAPRPTLNAPLRAYELDAELDGAARVFEMATTIFFTSIQSRRQ